MKLKRLAALAMASVMVVSVAACGDKTNENNNSNNSQGGSSEVTDDGGIISYADLDLDKDCKDLTTEITFSSNRTDLDAADYPGKNWDACWMMYARRRQMSTICV